MTLHSQFVAHWRKLLIIPPVLAGVGLILVGIAGKKPPERQKLAEVGQRVRYVEALSGSINPTVTGYGLIRPGRLWQAVAQAAGPIKWLHPDLKTGALFPRGTGLIRIDPAEYEATLAQAHAERDARLAKLNSTRALLAIEEQAQLLLAKDLERKRNLGERGTVAPVVVETSERALLAARTKVQALKNASAESEAELKVLAARVATAKLNLARTKISAPFDLRINELLTERAQYANRGAVLLKADGTETAEVTTRIQIGRLRPLVSDTGSAGWMLDKTQTTTAGPLGLKAKVILRRGEQSIVWPARVSRLAESLDPQTQTLGVIVAVDQPYAKAEPGVRPPLAPNTFVEVELRGSVLANQIIIPASVLRQGRIYVVSKDNRLEIRRVTLAYRQGRFAVIAQGLRAGERVVASDLIPAINGMLLDAEPDKQLMQKMQRFSSKAANAREARQ